MTPEELVKEYTDKSKPFPLPSLGGMYAHPRYVIHQHDLQELIDALRRLIRERDEARAAVTTANFVVAEYQRDLAEAEQRGYLKGLSDAQLAIHHADVLWAQSRAIDALKAKAKE